MVCLKCPIFPLFPFLPFFRFLSRVHTCLHSLHRSKSTGAVYLRSSWSRPLLDHTTKWHLSKEKFFLGGISKSEGFEIAKAIWVSTHSGKDRLIPCGKESETGEVTRKRLPPAMLYRWEAFWVWKWAIVVLLYVYPGTRHSMQHDRCVEAVQIRRAGITRNPQDRGM